VPEGNVPVVPSTDLRPELLPVIGRGWSRAKPWLVADNYGNTTATLSMRAEVQDKSVDLDAREPSFQVPPGRLTSACSPAGRTTCCGPGGRFVIRTRSM
jgi:hypothetical protein